ncbi:MAG: hypothetical protein KTR32_04945 [Granulosicoccus sp.]|nr:hypothetical protein [Granulosicoccus sp.]
MAFVDLQIPFFVPVWRRLVLLLICLGWGVFELLAGESLWATIFFAMGIFAAWQLFFSGWPKADTHADKR